jgi:hypothetical protein
MGIAILAITLAAGILFVAMVTLGGGCSDGTEV